MIKITFDPQRLAARSPAADYLTIVSFSFVEMQERASDLAGFQNMPLNARNYLPRPPRHAAAIKVLIKARSGRPQDPHASLSVPNCPDWIPPPIEGVVFASNRSG
jgi:hypothetical protein